VTSSITNKINLIHSVIELREDNIVCVLASDQVYSESNIRDINKAIGILTDQKRTLALIVASNYSDIEADARKFLSKPEAAMYSLAEAYVIKSLAQRLIANFYVRVSGTPVPTKFFTEQKQALEWLKSIKLR
jgi:hypothetical protein